MSSHKDVETRMQKAIDALSTDYSEIRAGRANAAVLDKVKVDYYGTPTPVTQLASVNVAEARVLVIQPWDKTLLKDIEKAINKSDIGINPQNDGNVIRLTFPQLTEDRRKELAKDIAKRGEQAKVAIRNVRRDGMDALKKQKKANEITEDELADAEEKIQKLTDKYVAKATDLEENKKKEILTV
ncbi:MAG: ribosome recycling factor [Acutalibacteraceae bacterium]|nr:ribosome recycling factor [Acutalibacteraceae bacterium]